MKLAHVELTIDGKTFITGQKVMTPKGRGIVISADPFADEEILVQLNKNDTMMWFSYRVVEHEEESL